MSVRDVVYALCDGAENVGLLSVLEPFGSSIRVKVPLSQRFCSKSIEGMMLSVRSVNGLMRAGANTIEKLVDVIMSEEGLEKVRNLGKKSVAEIKTALLLGAYGELDDSEKRQFWHDFLEENGLDKGLNNGGNNNA